MAGLRVFALLLVAGAWPAAAQQPALPPIDTDRPDFTDGTHTLATGHVQLETGYTYQQARGTDAGYTHSLPEALFRLGILSHVEFRIGENFLVERGDGPAATTTSGFDDLYLGTKVSLTAARGAMPALSFEVKVNVPTGSAAVSARRWLPGGAILLGWEGESPWSAGIELFVTRAAAGNGQGVASLSVQYQLQPVIQVYTEVFTQLGLGAGATGAAQYANSGVLVLLSNNVQVDGRLGVGLNRGADRFFAGFGFAVRR